MYDVSPIGHQRDVSPMNHSFAAVYVRLSKIANGASRLRLLPGSSVVSLVCCGVKLGIRVTRGYPDIPSRVAREVSLLRLLCLPQVMHGVHPNYHNTRNDMESGQKRYKRDKG